MYTKKTRKILIYNTFFIYLHSKQVIEIMTPIPNKHYNSFNDYYNIPQISNKTEEDGIINTTKYFDRLHDKLFNLNNLMIAAYVAIIVLPNIKASMYYIIFPLINMLLLLYLDYRMMKYSIKQSQITTLNSSQRDECYDSLRRTNVLSFVSIMLTLLTIGLFIYNIAISF